MNDCWANMLLSLVLQCGDSNQSLQDGPPLLSSEVMRPQRVAGDEKRGIYKASYPHDATIQDYIVIRWLSTWGDSNSNPLWVSKFPDLGEKDGTCVGCRQVMN